MLLQPQYHVFISRHNQRHLSLSHLYFYKRVLSSICIHILEPRMMSHPPSRLAVNPRLDLAPQFNLKSQDTLPYSKRDQLACIPLHLIYCNWFDY